MSKKNKYAVDKKNHENIQEAAISSNDSNEELEPQEMPILDEKIAFVEPQTFELHDAARRFIDKWEDRWLPGLQAYAKQMCVPELATEDAYRNLFAKFGLKLK